MPIFFYFLSLKQIEEECFFMIAEVSRRYDPPFQGFFTREESLDSWSNACRNLSLYGSKKTLGNE